MKHWQKIVDFIQPLDLISMSESIKKHGPTSFKITINTIHQ